jgi:rRNA maturation protein Nop10
MSYNSQDPYDAAAWWFMQLCCQECGTMLDLDLKSPHPVSSDDYWHEYGQRSKRSGWHIAEESVSPPAWLILCPVCAKKKASLT